VTAEADQALSEEVRFHRRLARSGTVVDVGAHTGGFVLALADLPELELVAVEPLAPALVLLRDAVRASGRQVRIVAAALGDALGTAVLQVPVLREGGAVWPWASVAKDFAVVRAAHPEVVDIQTFSVDITTLDGLALQGVTGLKVDAEGAEYEVLRGGRALLAEQRPIISVELEERHRAGCTYAVPAFLDALGYDGYFELEGRFWPMAAFDRGRMQVGSASPASHVYSSPYVGCFYFLPRERGELRALLG
jgi:FkbM family methyltransferase